MAPSPSVFLSAIAQRTSRLRFGPMVYTLAMYHPLRVLEEICMLDQMSRGRLDLGIGKGISPIEVGYYGVDPTKTEKVFGEAMAVIMQALTQKSVTYKGEFFDFKDVPMELQPYQQPHPPLWYGVVSPDSAARAAAQKMNIIANVSASVFRAMSDAYRKAYEAKHGGPLETRMGINRYIVIADTEEKALAIARPAYRRWHESFMALWTRHGVTPPNVNYPPEIDGQLADGRALATTPAKALQILQKQMEESGANYLVCRFAFGNMALGDSQRSLELFQRHVMPGLRESVAVAAE
jgi:alkanesulfonate monooxygenase SsuD/methylene tetrahydromethanopterin reductase-like flavin-dependent oxidoreductase (luciferase family)